MAARSQFTNAKGPNPTQTRTNSVIETPGIRLVAHTVYTPHAASTTTLTTRNHSTVDEWSAKSIGVHDSRPAVTAAVARNNIAIHTGYSSK